MAWLWEKSNVFSLRPTLVDGRGGASCKHQQFGRLIGRAFTDMNYQGLLFLSQLGANIFVQRVTLNLVLAILTNPDHTNIKM